MSTYTIKDLEHLTGIKAHTLRIWEQRYGVIKPKRTETNIRYYDDNDLKLVLNISLLKDNGYKISNICKLGLPDLQEEVRKLIDAKMSFPEQIHALTLAMLDLDEDRFEKIISTNTLQIGFERTMMNIIYPFFHRIGVLWQTGTITPAQEHFMSSLIRQKIIVAVDGQVVSNSDYHEKYLLFLPEGEMHEISILFSYYIIKSRSNKVVYLGQNVPFDDLEQVYDIHKPKYLLTVITSSPSKDFGQQYIDRLAAKFTTPSILVSGQQVVGQDLRIPDNVTVLNKLQDLIQFAGERSQSSSYNLSAAAHA